MYPCSLSDYVKNGNWYWLTAYILCHSTAIYLFLTSGANPGWVMPDSDYDSVEVQDSIDLEAGVPPPNGASSDEGTRFNGGEEEKSWNSDNVKNKVADIEMKSLI